MDVLVIGGTGLISTGIVKHLLARGAHVTAFNRGQRESGLDAIVQQIHGDRSDVAAFERRFEHSRFDVVIDMICFGPAEAESTVRAFGGRCEQVIFCSTTMTYGPKVPFSVLVDERCPQEPITEYGTNKLVCEKIFRAAAEEHKFRTTIVRPSSTYGPGGNLGDQLEAKTPSWDRIERGLPVLCAGDGLGLWMATHRDDVGKLFAYAALNPKTYGQAYNATRDHALTWRDYYREAATALGTRATLVFAPASWIIAHNSERFTRLATLTRFHAAYASAKARSDVPEFRCEIEFVDGARDTLADMRRRGAWVDARRDTEYQALVDEALGLGFSSEPA
jgi:nucleoside-diphosphate-sugar epimerase